MVFELSAEEKERKFKAVLSKELQRDRALNLPMVYRNELCIKPNMFIHKYPDGKRILIEQDLQNSTEKIIRILD